VFTGLEGELFLIKQGLNPLLFNVDNCEYNSFGRCHPIFITGSTCLGLASAAYNFFELYQSFKQRELRQGDRPFMGAMAGWSEIILGSRVFQFYPARQIITGMDPTTGKIHKIILGSAFGEYLHDFLVFHGEYQLFSYTFQMLKNIKNLVRGNPSVLIESVTPQEILAIQNSPKPLSNKREKKLKQYTSTDNKTTYSIQNVTETTLPTESQTVVIRKEPKLKRRGIPDISKSTKAPTYERTSSKVDNELINSNNDILRIEALNSINELRRFNAVKKKYINALLSDTCKFVDGSIHHIDGSESAIVLHRELQRVSVKYERPHGADNGVYKGYKLKRVLNAIETAYMYDWDEQSILNYMNNYGIKRIYQVPNNLLYILWTRPDL
jgi:hypothetical protein